jgi:hypothetical protein
MQRSMDTLFDPDDLAGRPLPSSPRAAPEEIASERAERSRPEAADWMLARLGTSGGGPMLDDLVAGLWEGLAAHRVVECPVCSSAMRPEYGAHALPIGGRCGGCGSTLT